MRDHDQSDSEASADAASCGKNIVFHNHGDIGNQIGRQTVHGDFNINIGTFTLGLARSLHASSTSPSSLVADADIRIHLETCISVVHALEQQRALHDNEIHGHDKEDIEDAKELDLRLATCNDILYELQQLQTRHNNDEKVEPTELSRIKGRLAAQVYILQVMLGLSARKNQHMILRLVRDLTDEVRSGRLPDGDDEIDVVDGVFNELEAAGVSNVAIISQHDWIVDVIKGAITHLMKGGHEVESNCAEHGSTSSRGAINAALEHLSTPGVNPDPQRRRGSAGQDGTQRRTGRKSSVARDILEMVFLSDEDYSQRNSIPYRHVSRGEVERQRTRGHAASRRSIQRQGGRGHVGIEVRRGSVRRSSFSTPQRDAQRLKSLPLKGESTSYSVKGHESNNVLLSPSSLPISSSPTHASSTPIRCKVRPVSPKSASAATEIGKPSTALTSGSSSSASQTSRGDMSPPSASTSSPALVSETKQRASKGRRPFLSSNPSFHPRFSSSLNVQPPSTKKKSSGASLNIDHGASVSDSLSSSPSPGLLRRLLSSSSPKDSVTKDAQPADYFTGASSLSPSTASPQKTSRSKSPSVRTPHTQKQAEEVFRRTTSFVARRMSSNKSPSIDTTSTRDEPNTSSSPTISMTKSKWRRRASSTSVSPMSPPRSDPIPIAQPKVAIASGVAA